MRQIVVGVGDGGVSRNPDSTIVTYALGSCVAVILYDPVAKVAGMLHYMLPESSISKTMPRVAELLGANPSAYQSR